MQLIIPTELPLYAQLTRLVQEQRIVFFAGLPGVGKSLLLQQIGLMAHLQGRQVHQLQWDVTRAAFESDAIMTRYPEVDGITHAVIRKAVGLWSRAGVESWHQQSLGTDHMLIGEVPLVGNRLIELVQMRKDAAESLLAHPQTTFAIPVPSVEIRTLIETTRKKSIANPRHERERKDAPPNVLNAMWAELFDVGQMLNLVDVATTEPTYSPSVYGSLYQYFLRHRNVEMIPLEQQLDTSSHSVYDVAFEPVELAPTQVDAETFIAQVEGEYPDLDRLEEEINQWYNI